MAAMRMSKVILLTLLIVCTAPTVMADDQNIGLRLSYNGKKIPIAVGPAASSPLKIYKNGTVYGIQLVDTSDPLATNLRINLPGNVVKAIKRYVAKVTFNAANAPLYNPPSLNDPNDQCYTTGRCGWTNSNGLFPVQISDNTQFSPGETLTITNTIGQLCYRVATYAKTNPYSDGWCKDCCCRNVSDYCADIQDGGPFFASLGNQADLNAFIGFYRTNSASTANTPIAEYTLYNFYHVNPDGTIIITPIPIPAGTNYIFVYFKEGLSGYYDNNIAYKMVLEYEIN